MRRIIRRLLQPILWWAYRRYSRKERRYRMDGITLFLAPSVFHPAWMLTTRTMTEFALEQGITGKKVYPPPILIQPLLLPCIRVVTTINFPSQ